MTGKRKNIYVDPKHEETHATVVRFAEAKTISVSDAVWRLCAIGLATKRKKNKEAE